MNINFASLKKEFEQADAWGLHSGIDLHECNPETIRSPEKIKQFVIELCDLIEMRRYGECVVVDFGDDPRVAGYAMTQLIETSLISAHLGSALHPFVYLDIFSCKYYDPSTAAEFAKKFFEAKNYTLNSTIRK